eukprot:m.361806 g.361806  ORF g.361806 m.361806 type:complete len:878 (+) comp19921_c0_seq1:188-2821(+)
MAQLDEDKLSYVVQLLHGSMHPRTAHQCSQELEEYKESAEFNSYLLCIIANTELDWEIRSASCLALKNNALQHPECIDEQLLQTLESLLQPLLSDEQTLIRRTAGILVGGIVRQVHIQHWPNLLPAIISFLELGDDTLNEGVFQVIDVLCEDCFIDMIQIEVEPQLTIILQACVHFFEHPSPRIRYCALHSCNQFISSKSLVLLKILKDYVEGLFKLAADDSADVVRTVCEAFVELIDTRFEHSSHLLVPEMPNIFQYMLAQTQSADGTIAMQACKFWPTVAVLPNVEGFVRSVLAELVPVLVHCMQHTAEDLAGMQRELRDDAQEEDRECDIATHHSKERHGAGSYDEEEGDDEEDEEENDDDIENSQWTLRNIAAASLDKLSHSFPELLEIVVPHIVQGLNSENWLEVETSVMALGAISNGCREGLEEHLVELHSYILNCIPHAEPLVRQISCWTLSRFSARFLEIDDDGLALQSMVTALLERIFDGNKRVQQQACYSMAQLEEDAGNLLVPHLAAIVPALAHAYDNYRKKSTMSLYDTIGTLADSVPGIFETTEYVDLFMQRLLTRWQELPLEDVELVPLLECLQFFVAGMGDHLATVAQDVLGRCLAILSAYLETESKDDFPVAAVTSALDLLDALLEGLDVNAPQALEGIDILQVLAQLIQDPLADVRQCALGALGELSNNCGVLLHDHLEAIVAVLVENMDPLFASVCNNTIWTLSRLSSAFGEDLQPYYPTLLEHLIPLINRKLCSPMLLENLALCIGILGRYPTQELIDALPDYLVVWSTILRDVQDNPEKADAFVGMCLVIKHNPQAALRGLVYFLDAVASWEQPPPELQQMFAELIEMFVTNMGENWTAFVEQLPQQLHMGLSPYLT